MGTGAAAPWQGGWTLRLRPALACPNCRVPLSFPHGGSPRKPIYCERCKCYFWFPAWYTNLVLGLAIGGALWGMAAAGLHGLRLCFAAALLVIPFGALMDIVLGHLLRSPLEERPPPGGDCGADGTGRRE